MRKVSIIIPIIRPESAERCVQAIHKNAGIPMDQYEIVQGVDTQGVGCPWMVKQLTKKAKYDLVMFLGDDTEPQEGFLKASIDEMDKLTDGWGVVGLNTEDPRGSNPMCHWLSHKKMLDHIPGGDFFSTEYRHCFCDNELCDIANELGRWAFAEDAKVKHHHPVNQSGKWDEGYQKAYDERVWIQDQKRYFIRKRERMANKFGVKIAYAEPLTFQMIYSNYHFSSMRLVSRYLINRYRAGEPIGFEFLCPDNPGRLDLVRNDLIRKALYQGCTHILMMDTDEFTEYDNLIDQMLSHGKPIVHAKVHRRYPPFDHLLMRGTPNHRELVPDEEIEKGELIEIDATGCGCVLYDTNIFIDLDDPWFEDGPEDIKFCNKLKKAGYKIFVDTSIDVKHLSLLAVDWGTHKLYKKLKGVN